MPRNGASPRVLIADDEPVIADTLAEILNRYGFQAHAVYSGETAVETAVMLKPNVLISDVMMRGMNGIDAAIRISANLPACKIILFSGTSSTTDLLHDAEAQGHHFEMLAKPIHPLALLDRLGNLQLTAIA